MRELPILAGHLALDFVNTIDDPHDAARYDHVATLIGLLQWSVRVRVLTHARAERLRRTTRAATAAETVHRAHDLRDALRATFTAVAAGQTPAVALWADLKPFVLDAVAHADLVPDSTGLHLAWPDADDPHAVLWPIAQSALDLLTTGDLRRIKRCAGCEWLFLDRSKNASRRWCAMTDCGTQAKIRRYVARRASRDASRRD